MINVENTGGLMSFHFTLLIERPDEMKSVLYAPRTSRQSAVSLPLLAALS